MTGHKMLVQLRRFLTTDVAIKSALASSASLFMMLMALEKVGSIFLAGFFLLIAMTFLICIILAPAIEALRK